MVYTLPSLSGVTVRCRPINSVSVFNNRCQYYGAAFCEASGAIGLPLGFNIPVETKMRPKGIGVEPRTTTKKSHS